MEVSVIIPAFNEAARLPAYLREVLDYLPREHGDDFEVVVVDDGSADETADRVRELAAAAPRLRLIQHEQNRGKGQAVRTGMLDASGRLRLFADADGSTPIDQERRLRALLEGGCDVAMGSRSAAAGDNPELPAELRIATWDVKPHRHVIGRVFALLTRMIVGVRHHDTQCGFKMFRADAAQTLFETAAADGYEFDVEVLLIADRLGLKVIETPVDWHETEGTKIRLARDSWRMFRGLWTIRRSHRDLARRERGG